MEAINVPDLFSVKGKTALITGGSRGIGEMIATGFLESGAKVYISSRKAGVCDATAKELSALGPCFSIPADVSDLQGVQHLASEFAKRETKLDILVNNAGASWGAALEEYPESGWDKVMDTNVKGIYYLTVALLPQLEAAGQPGNPARVINIGSINGLRVPNLPNWAYGASKAAVHHLTAVLGKELGPRHISVNAIAPGPFETKMNQMEKLGMVDQVVKGCPLGRIGVPGDMAGVALFLASRAGSYLNGVVIPVDGGIIL